MGFKEFLVNQLSECLITDDGKRRASQILGLKTFKDMYFKPSRRSQSSQPPVQAGNPGNMPVHQQFQPTSQVHQPQQTGPLQQQPQHQVVPQQTAQQAYHQQVNALQQQHQVVNAAQVYAAQQQAAGPPQSQTNQQQQQSTHGQPPQQQVQYHHGATLMQHHGGHTVAPHFYHHQQQQQQQQQHRHYSNTPGAGASGTSSQQQQLSSSPSQHHQAQVAAQYQQRLAASSQVQSPVAAFYHQQPPPQTQQQYQQQQQHQMRHSAALIVAQQQQQQQQLTAASQQQKQQQIGQQQSQQLQQQPPQTVLQAQQQSSAKQLPNGSSTQQYQQQSSKNNKPGSVEQLEGRPSQAMLLSTRAAAVGQHHQPQYHQQAHHGHYNNPQNNHHQHKQVMHQQQPQMHHQQQHQQHRQQSVSALDSSEVQVIDSVSAVGQKAAHYGQISSVNSSDNTQMNMMQNGNGHQSQATPGDMFSNEKILERRKYRVAELKSGRQDHNMFNIAYELLELDHEKNQPCYFDNKNVNYHKQEVHCFCDPSQRHSPKLNNDPNTKLLKCTRCQKLSHEACASFNAKMKKFMCASCQLILMDPFYKPVMTLIDPFIVYKYNRDEKRDNAEKIIFPPEARQSFEFSQECMKALMSERNLIKNGSAQKQLNCVIQLRCIAQNNQDGLLSHAFPTFGHYRLHGLQATRKHFLIQPYPNNHKRKDKVFDLTRDICELQLQGGKIYIELMQNVANVDNRRDKDVTYVCGLFIAKTIQLPEIVNFVTNFMPVITYAETFEKIEKLHQEALNEEDDGDLKVDTTKIKISLLCSITCMRLQVPVKGQWCSHFDCFNLETYLGMNAITQKTRNWVCPLFPTEKPMILQRDEFLTQILSLTQEYDTEIEVNYKDLTIRCLQSGSEFRLTSKGIIDIADDAAVIDEVEPKAATQAIEDETAANAATMHPNSTEQAVTGTSAAIAINERAAAQVQAGASNNSQTENINRSILEAQNQKKQSSAIESQTPPSETTTKNCTQSSGVGSKRLRADTGQHLLSACEESELLQQFNSSIQSQQVRQGSSSGNDQAAFLDQYRSLKRQNVGGNTVVDPSNGTAVAPITSSNSTANNTAQNNNSNPTNSNPALVNQNSISSFVAAHQPPAQNTVNTEPQLPNNKMKNTSSTAMNNLLNTTKAVTPQLTSANSSSAGPGSNQSPILHVQQNSSSNNSLNIQQQNGVHPGGVGVPITPSVAINNSNLTNTNSNSPPRSNSTEMQLVREHHMNNSLYGGNSTQLQQQKNILQQTTTQLFHLQKIQHFTTQLMQPPPQQNCQTNQIQQPQTAASQSKKSTPPETESNLANAADCTNGINGTTNNATVVTNSTIVKNNNQQISQQSQLPNILQQTPASQSSTTSKKQVSSATTTMAAVPHEVIDVDLDS